MVPLKTTANWRIFFWAGVTDLTLGLGMIVIGLVGMGRPGAMIYMIVGSVLAIGGGAIVAFSRNKLGRGDSFGGDKS